MKEYIDLDISPGIIIGRGGKIIQEIERTTNAKVRILREENKILISGYKQDYINIAIPSSLNLPTFLPISSFI